MLSYDYKGCTIYPVPQPIGSGGHWRTELLVRRNLSIMTYRFDEEFDTEGEAVFHCLRHGKELVDAGTVLNNEPS